MPNYVDNKPISVTKIRVAFECPRLFYLGHKFNNKMMFKSPDYLFQGLGVFFHKLAENCVNAILGEPDFIHYLDFTPHQLNQENLTKVMRCRLYELVFFPYLETVKNDPQKTKSLLTLWERLTNLIEAWAKLLIDNRLYFSAQEVIKKTFIKEEYNLQYNFELSNKQKQLVKGQLDSLVFDGQRNRLSVVEYKTYKPLDSSSQLVQVALYSYMLYHNKGIKADAQVYYISPEFKADFYAWEQLEKTIYKMIPYKLQQMQKWLTWKKGESNPPPPTTQPHLCQVCPERPKCQNFFNVQ